MTKHPDHKALNLISCQCDWWVLPSIFEVGLTSPDISVVEAIASLQMQVRVACPVCGLLYERAPTSDGRAMTWVLATGAELHN